MSLPSILSDGPVMQGGMEIAIKSTFVLAGAFVVHAALRRRYPLACSAMWNGCLVALIVLPVSMLILPAIAVPAPWLLSQTDEVLLEHNASTDSSPPNTARTSGWSTSFNGKGEDADQGSELAPVAAAAATARRSTPATDNHSGGAHRASDLPGEQGGDWRAGLVAVYAAGVGLLTIRLLLNLLAVRRLRTGTVMIHDDAWQACLAHWSAALGLRRRVIVLSSNAVAVPVVVGVARPAIILPPEHVGRLSGQRRDAVVIHELAHVRRCDYAWQLLLSVVQLVYWPQPLVWLAGRSIARLRERACDDICVHALGGRDEYRATLLDLAQALVGPRALSLGMAAVRSSKIARRVKAIDRSMGNPHCLARCRTRWSLALTLASIAIVVGAMHPRAAGSATEAQESQSTTVNAAPTERQGGAQNQSAENDNLTVIVVDGNGKPLAGLEVQAFRSWTSGPYKPEKSFTTDDQGRLLVPRQLTEDDNGLQLVARDKEDRLGYITIHPRRFAAQKEQQEDRFELRLLTLERTIRGKLVDQDGRPVARAVVGIRSIWQRDSQYRYIDWYGPPNSSPMGHATSQDDGIFTLRVPQSPYCAVQIVHRDFVAVHKNYLGGEDDLGTVSLRPGATIAGRAVHAATGKPVAGARIFASDQLDDRDEPKTGEIRYGSVYTDADGKYEIASLKPGVYHIVLYSVEGQPQLTAVAHERLPIEGGRATTADFRVIDGRLLAGSVVDIDDGAPIKSIQVAVNSPAFPRSSRGGHHHVRTDDEGRFRFYLPPGEANVHINEGENSRLPESKRSVFLEPDSPLEPIVLRGRSRENEQKQNQLRVSGGYATTTTTEETKKDADLVPKQREITIRFRTSDGKPVGPSITEIWSRGGGPNMKMGYSGSEFSFPERYIAGFGPSEVPNTDDGRTSYLVIDPQGYARPAPVAVRAGQEQSTITIDLKTPNYVRIRGRVVDGQGAPITGANIATWLYTLGKRSDEPWGAQYVTDKQGRFETRHTYVGNRISLHITKSGWSGVLIEPRLLADASPIDLGDLVMTDPNGEIEGRVVDMNDQPLPGLVVAEQKHKIQTRTNAQGRFRLTSLPVGEARVAVVGNEYESYPRDVTVGTRDMLIKLYPKSPERRPNVSMIRAKFQTANGKPVKVQSSFWWIDIAAEPTLWMTTSRDDDNFEFSNVWQHPLAKDKPQRLVMDVAGYKRPEPLEVATNKDLNLVIKLEPASRVPTAGRVVDSDGKPIEGATVWTTLKIWGQLYSDAWGPPTKTDKAGRFALKHIKEDDDFAIHVGKPGYAGTTQYQTAQTGAPIDLGELRLRPADARLTGMVIDRARKPVAGARVYSNYLGKTFEATTDATGRFALSGLPDGSVILTVEADTFREQHRADSNNKDVTIQQYPY